jgi:restriction endonuclease S subunit
MAKNTQPSTKSEEQNERFTLFSKTSLINKIDWITRKRSLDENGRVTRTDLVNEALEEFVSKWEKKHGPISIK